MDRSNSTPPTGATSRSRPPRGAFLIPRPLAVVDYFKACCQHAWHPKDCTTRLEHINYHFRQGGEHRYAYDFETAEKLLRGVGFSDVLLREFDPSLDSKHREIGSLFMSARKPA